MSELKVVEVRGREGYRPDIDGLRALAVMPVVLGHAGFPGFSGGFIGVDVFFVISGFLITGILLREISADDFSVARFYERRARRILPALFAMMLACVVMGWLLMPPEALGALGRSVMATILFLSNAWFARSTEDYFGTDAEWEPLLHTWSLSVEEQFYLVFPLLLWLLARRSKTSTVSGVAMVTGVSLLFSIWQTRADPTAAYFLTPARVWELGAGALLAMGVLPGVRRRAVAECISVTGLLMIIFGVILYGPQTPFPGAAALLPVTGAIALIWSGSVSNNRVSQLLGSRIPVGIGLISYSLYLWHWPVLVGARLLQGSSHLATAGALIAVAISLVLAWISWKFIEQPFRGGSNARVSKLVLVRLSAFGAILFLATGSAIKAFDGFPGRLPEAHLAVYQQAFTGIDRQERCMKRTPATELCSIGSFPDGSQQSSSLFLWGDSHAAAWLPGFDHLLETHKYTGMAALKSGCPPLLGLRRQDKSASHRCDQFNDQVLALLQSREDLPVVVLAARWALAVEKTRPEGGEGMQLASVKSFTAPIPAWAAQATDTHRAALVAHRLDQTVAAIRATGREVVLIKGVPEIGHSVPADLAKAAFTETAVSEGPAASRVEARQRQADEIIELIAERHGAHTVNPRRLMCDDNCRIAINSQLLYRDDDHLTAFAARQLLPVLADQAPPIKQLNNRLILSETDKPTGPPPRG
ncbi:acyltransferase family protein [Microbulbifer bruguierae]|uniref:Acyltransferase family protein n=1 Tax=Microbulbifer bruguierae TaxID=3029061 RepID=A0ABY8NGD6_9GAMM|nr:acyltransferase family protein [Microbulbifer bruguierae]WGL17991.1 acyltransferase family protein [Microbulbifer bruguierae]